MKPTRGVGLSDGLPTAALRLACVYSSSAGKTTLMALVTISAHALVQRTRGIVPSFRQSLANLVISVSARACSRLSTWESFEIIDSACLQGLSHLDAGRVVSLVSLAIPGRRLCLRCGTVLAEFVGSRQLTPLLLTDDLAATDLKMVGTTIKAKSIEEGAWWFAGPAISRLCVGIGSFCLGAGTWRHYCSVVVHGF